MDDRRRLFHLFAQVLEYPGSSLLASAGECARRLEKSCPEAAEYMRAFAAFAEGTGLDRMEEIYTRTFDITPTANLYVGYHLFGESFKRGAFLVKLQEAYEAHGFAFGPELADHLSVILRFVSVVDDPLFVDPLVEEGVLPLLEKVEEAFKESSGGYALVISSLGLFLRQECPAIAAGGLHHD